MTIPDAVVEKVARAITKAILLRSWQLDDVVLADQVDDNWRFNIDAARAALEAAGYAELVEAATETRAELAKRQWQPIETALKNGSYVLLFSPDDRDRRPWIGQWRDDEDYPDGGAWWQDNEGGFPVDADPSHWRPLPAPPVSP